MPRVGFTPLLVRLSVSALLTAALVAGFLAGLSADVPVASAACGSAYNCGMDGSATSSLTVSHSQSSGGTVTPVEPDDGETWTITATWSSDLAPPNPVCKCANLATATATVDVTWSEASGWSASCTSGCNATLGPIFKVAICGVDGCGENESIDNSWSYELIVDILHTQQPLCGGGNPNAYLSDVAYATTVVDDGNLIDESDCSEGTSVSPTSQTFSTNDSGVFECSFDCDDASGPSITITY